MVDLTEQEAEQSNERDGPLHPEVVRWLHTYARASSADRDAVVAEILHALSAELLRMEATIERREAQLAETQQIARLGSWDWNIAEDRASLSDELYRILGWEPRSAPVSSESLFRCVVPEDAQRVRAMAEAAVSSGEARDFETRILRPDGEQRFIHVRAAVMCDRSGSPERMVGTVQDITECKQGEEALRLSDERFRVALRNSPVIVFAQDTDLRFTWVYNPTPGRTPESVVGKTDAELHRPEDAALLTAIKRQALQTGVGSRQEVHLAVNGEQAYFDLNIEPLRDLSGEIVGITGAATNITERKRVDECRAVQREQRARLAGLLYAARQLSHGLTDDLSVPAGAIDMIQPHTDLSPRLRELADDAADGLSTAMERLARFRALLQAEMDNHGGEPPSPLDLTTAP